MTSPLQNTNCMSINELMERDPLSITEADKEEITAFLVDAFRTERQVWQEEKSKAKLTGKKIAGGTVKKKQKQAVLEKIKSGEAKIDLSSLMKK